MDGRQQVLDMDRPHPPLIDGQPGQQEGGAAVGRRAGRREPFVALALGFALGLLDQCGGLLPGAAKDTVGLAAGIGQNLLVEFALGILNGGRHD